MGMLISRLEPVDASHAIHLNRTVRTLVTVSSRFTPLCPCGVDRWSFLTLEMPWRNSGNAKDSHSPEIVGPRAALDRTVVQRVLPGLRRGAPCLDLANIFHVIEVDQPLQISLFCA